MPKTYLNPTELFPSQQYGFSHNDLPIQEALLAFFPPDRLPASTFIGVQALANPDFLVEIEATAVIE